MRRPFPAALLSLLLLILAACGESTSGSSASPDLGTIDGRVLLGPTCPIETEASPCPDEPMDGETVELRSDGAVVDTVTSDADGAFVFEVEPGTYELAWAPEGDPGIRTARPVRVTVVAGESVTADLLVDTGLR